MLNSLWKTTEMLVSCLFHLRISSEVSVSQGKHDITFDPSYYNTRGGERFHGGLRYDTSRVRQILVDSTEIVYLEDSAYDVPTPSGHVLKLYGTPHQPEFCDWAFNLPRGDATRAQAERIPSSTDVLISHGPPHGHGDQTSEAGRVGCEEMLAELQQRVQPAVHIFGHIHSGYGVSSDGTTAYANASCCTSQYEPINAPLVFDLAFQSTGQLGRPVFVKAA